MNEMWESVLRCRDLLDKLPAAIYTTDAVGRLSYSNPALTTLIGYASSTNANSVHDQWKLFFPNGDPLPYDRCPMARALSERRPIQGVEILLERADGRRLSLQVYATPLFDDHGELIGGTNLLLDITELKSIDLQRILETAALATLNQLSSQLWNTRSLGAGLDEMLSATIELLDADFGNIQILDPVKGVLRIAASRGFQTDFLDHFREVSAGDGSVCGQALQAAERIIVEDVDSDDRCVSIRGIARSAGYRAVQSTPLIGHSGNPLGMISTHFRDPHRPTEHEFRLLDLYARQAADFIERCNADEERRQTEQARWESEARLAVELKGMTRLHELSMRLARENDLERVIYEVMIAAGELLGAECLSAQLLDPNDQSLHLVADNGFEPDFLETFRIVTKKGASTCAAALRRRERVIVEDLAADPEFRAFAAQAAPTGVIAAVSTPLLADDGRLVGLFTAYWRRPHLPSEHQLRLLDLYVQQAARQVERRASEMALRESQQQLATQVADLETLRRLSLRVAATPDRTAALNDILETAISLVGAAKGNVQLYDPSDETLKIIAHRGFDQEFLEYFKSVPLGYSCCGAAMEERKRVIIKNVRTDERFSELAEIYVKHGFTAVQSTPLFNSDGHLMGMFSTHFAEPHEPSERDLRVLDQIAQQAGRIIERTSAEQALRESEKRFRTLVETSPFGMYIVDSQLRIMHMNARSQNGAFRNVHPVIGCDLQDALCILWPDEVAQEIVASFRHTLQTGEPFCSKDFLSRRADDDVIEAYEWELQRFMLPNNKFGVICYYFDSSDLRRAQEALREADRRKDEFLATLAHELRNPLAPIRSGLEVMRIAKDNAATIEELRRTMVRQTDQLVRLIDDLLDISRITRGQLQLQLAEIAIQEVVKSAIEATGPYIDERRHQLTVQLPPERIFVECDPHRLAQVLSNLLHNAAKYSPQPGPILLTARVEDRDIVVSVTDHGVGIPPDKVNEVFEMFAQIGRSSKQGYTGLGIGLTLAKSFVEMHGGTIEIKSDGLNQGTQVILNLANCIKRIEGEAHVADIDNDGPLLPKQRVLIVDDNQDAARLLAIFVQMLGNDVKVAHDGREAVEQAADFCPDIVLLDLGMPVMDGYQAAEKIRQAPWGTDVILVALTGWGQEEDKRRTREVGFDHHLVKPADPETLKAILAKKRGVVENGNVVMK